MKKSPHEFTLKHRGCGLPLSEVYQVVTHVVAEHSDFTEQELTAPPSKRGFQTLADARATVIYLIHKITGAPDCELAAVTGIVRTTLAHRRAMITASVDSYPSVRAEIADLAVKCMDALANYFPDRSKTPIGDQQPIVYETR